MSDEEQETKEVRKEAERQRSRIWRRIDERQTCDVCSSGTRVGVMMETTISSQMGPLRGLLCVCPACVDKMRVCVGN